ncbi:MAG: hypothetical protein L0Y56_12650, partial [Nitrospira sp.]|nr:hypothetical protein [Nitrospira sp.]
MKRQKAKGKRQKAKINHEEHEEARRKTLYGPVWPFVDSFLSSLFCLLSFVFCLLPLTASAQVLPNQEPAFQEEEFFRVEQLITIGSRRLQHLNESPSAVAVITAEDIRQSGAIDIVDLFRIIPGMDVITLDGP